MMKRLFLIGIAIILLVVLLFLAKGKQTSTPQNSSGTSMKVSASYAKIALSLPAMPTRLPNDPSRYQLPVLIDTSGQSVTGVQIELKYDPAILKNVTLSPVITGFFTYPQVFVTKSDPSSGTIFLSLGTSPQIGGKKGSGDVALLTFSPIPAKRGIITQISFTTETRVSAEGHAPSVLKSTKGTAFRIE